MEPLPGLGRHAEWQRGEVGLIRRAAVKTRMETPAVMEVEISADRAARTPAPLWLPRLSMTTLVFVVIMRSVYQTEQPLPTKHVVPQSGSISESGLELRQKGTRKALLSFFWLDPPNNYCSPYACSLVQAVYRQCDELRARIPIARSAAAAFASGVIALTVPISLLGMVSIRCSSRAKLLTCLSRRATST